MITGINDSKILTKHAWNQCKYKFDERKYNSNQKWNNDKWQWKCKKHHIYEKHYVWDPATCSCQNGKFLTSIINDSVITCGEIIKETKNTPTNFNEKI